MLTLIGYGVLAVVIAAALFLLAANFLPAGVRIAPAVRDDAPWTLPAGRDLDSADVERVRLPVSLRGYRFRETDALLDRLADEIRRRDEEIARLRGTPSAASAAPAAPTPDG
ncbi:MAG: DivIVA domain-containing protein [Jatrophihabitans sp.]|nr:MAG: DivIVA domain-containing protein [Jatrophihabitans sp.]